MKNNVQLYNETIEQFKEHVNELEKVAKKYAASDLQQAFQELGEVLARNHFEIIVVGEFSNGKSTFINALLRERFLPSSINPTTAMLNKISYADEKSYALVYRDGKKRTLTEEDFKAIVAPDSKPSLLGNLFGIEKEKKELSMIREAELGFPTAFCENNITIIDSPGTNDFDAAREAITTHYIPRSDAAIFLLNATKPFSESDKVFLGRILDEHLHKIFFLVNFKDLLENEVDEHTALDYIRKQLATLVPDPKIYLISAQHALLNHVGEAAEGGRRRRKPILPLEETGMPAFEAELDHFLAYDTGFEKLVKLRAMYDESIEQLIHDHLLHEKSMLRNANNLSQKEIARLEVELQALETNMQGKMEGAESQIAMHANTLKNWYHSELTNISNIALSTLDELYTFDADQAKIKHEIERRTGRLESNMPQQVNNKLQGIVRNLFGQDMQQFQQQLNAIKTDVSQLKSSSSASWNREIDRYEYKESYGGFFGSIFTAVRDFFTGDRKAVDVKAKMRQQIMERYSNQISDQVANFEQRVIAQLKHVITEAKRTIKRQITDERNRNKRALQAAEAKQDELEQKLHLLTKDVASVTTGQQYLLKTIENYLKQVK